MTSSQDGKARSRSLARSIRISLSDKGTAAARGQEDPRCTVTRARIGRTDGRAASEAAPISRLLRYGESRIGPSERGRGFDGGRRGGLHRHQSSNGRRKSGNNNGHTISVHFATLKLGDGGEENAIKASEGQ